MLGSGAMFTVFTYIAPILQSATHVSYSIVALAPVIYGMDLTTGNWLGGHLADRALHVMLVVVLGPLTALLVLFAFTMRPPVPAVATIFAWDVATFALVLSLQTRIMSVATDAPTLASSLNIGAFHLGNAAGAALGGCVIRLHLGYPWVAVAGAAMAAGALVLVLAAKSDETPSRSLR
jgi:MFS transporter, DHA1 family, inner membrane transport protein